MGKIETDTQDLDSEPKITLGLLNMVHDNSTDEDRAAILLNLMGREVKVRVPLETV